MILAAATDQQGGVTFATTWTFPGYPGFVDRPSIATGPGGSSAPSSVWITFLEFGNKIFAKGAKVWGLGSANVGSWSALVPIPGTSYSNGLNFRPEHMAIGPTGEVAIVIDYTDSSQPTPVSLSVNPYGVNQVNGFPAELTPVRTSYVQWLQKIPATKAPGDPQGRGIGVLPELAWDRTGGAYSNRLYMVYTDRPQTDANNTDIYVIRSDLKGAAGSWSAPVKINTDSGNTSQFFPAIAVDETSGKVAVSWYDCRGDTATNRKTRFYAAVSSDGGRTFSVSNIQLETAESDTWATNRQYDWYYFDYTRAGYYGGWFYPAWADNSSTTGDNPDRTGQSPTYQMDVYVARLRY